MAYSNELSHPPPPELLPYLCHFGALDYEFEEACEHAKECAAQHKVVEYHNAVIRAYVLLYILLPQYNGIR